MSVTRSSGANAGSDGELVACPECDALVHLFSTAAQCKQCCPRCHHTLSISGKDRLKLALPLGICAALLMLLSLYFPFMSFERAGVANQMTLLQTAWALFTDGSVLLAGLVLVFIVISPMVLVACVLLISLTLYTGRFAQLSMLAANLLYSLTSWSMVEVFIIGVFVSLVKIAGMATVELGVSLWSYLALSFALVGAISSLDKVSVWQQLARHGRLP
ncbi:paraquat-inducible protein A [Parahaliea mediterranea]|uniref:paraquat-inducible protein A n=1 Tax=Parahaliea mediterranea TaxID=651086 RepID=UPI0013009553|nr:paraquat-inducible protein A [Parahaliea mediterranea]